MATGQTLVDRALRLIGQIAAGEDPTTDESNDALEAMNAMIASWNNEGLMDYALQEETLTLANGDSSYTIGPSGDLNTTRPVAIEAAWIVDNDVSYRVKIIDDHQYAAIQDKTTESDWPDALNYKATMATGTITVYPVPNATRTLKLLTRIPLSALTLAGTISLPPGWERAIASNLAVEIAPEYETSPSPEVVKMARESKAEIKRANSKPLYVQTDIGVVFSLRRSNIEAGY